MVQTARNSDLRNTLGVYKVKRNHLNAAFVVIGQPGIVIYKNTLGVYVRRIFHLHANNLIIWQSLAVIYRDTLKVNARKRYQ